MAGSLALLGRYANWSGSRVNGVDVSHEQPFKALHGYRRENTDKFSRQVVWSTVYHEILYLRRAIARDFLRYRAPAVIYSQLYVDSGVVQTRQ
jgi:hypothetical protein